MNEQKSYITTPEESQEEKAQKEQETMEFFHQLEPLGDVFVGSWGYHVKFDPKAESFYFDHKNKEIGIGTQLIEKLDLKDPEKQFAFIHELGHLSQLFQSPEDYLESFEIPKQKAEQAEDAHKKFTEQAWRRFFNVFFDIHDNSLVVERTPSFQKGEKHENLASNLYKDKLFAETDYSKLPHSEQFIDFLLKQVMAPGTEAKIADAVKEVISRPVKLMGFEYDSVLEFVKQEIYNSKHNCEDLMFNLRQRLMPIFQDLLKEDIKAGRTQSPQKQKMDFDEGLSEEVIKDIIENHKEAQKPSSEKMQDAKDQEFKDWAEGEGFSETEIERMLEIKEATKKIHQDLRSLWDNFIQKSVEIQQEKRTGFTRGAGIAGEKIAGELGILLTDPSKAEIFYRYVSQIEKESIKPKKIHLFLIPDLSGSMDKGKRQAVQEVAYSIDKSLIDWHRDAKNAVRDQGQESPIDINLDMIGFGSSLKPDMIPRDPQEKQEQRKIDNPPKKDIEQELWQGIFDIQKTDLVGTQDAPALDLVEKGITPEIEEKLNQEDEIMIVLEITDGETTTAVKSKELVQSLNDRKGVFARAIQIPGPIYSEEEPKTEQEKMEPPKVLAPTGTFKEVWGDYGRKLEQLSVLKETVFQVLQDALIEN